VDGPPAFDPDPSAAAGNRGVQIKLIRYKTYIAGIARQFPEKNARWTRNR
jgi:hypothetical protein